jgi:toxin YoeB
VAERTGGRAAIRALEFDADFLEDLRYWIATNQRVATRLADLMEAIRRDPFRGMGKPEPLKHLGANIWSRRLTDEHRVVYQVEHTRIVFTSARGHYE